MVERVGSAYKVVERKLETDVTAIVVVGEKARGEPCAKRTQLRDVMSSSNKNLTKVWLAVGKLKHGFKDLKEQINRINLLYHSQGP